MLYRYIEWEDKEVKKKNTRSKEYMTGVKKKRTRKVLGGEDPTKKRR